MGWRTGFDELGVDAARRDRDQRTTSPTTPATSASCSARSASIGSSTGRADPRLRGAALAAGAQPYRLAEGGEIDSGGLRLSALWPPRELLGETGEDPNLLCLVLVAQWRHFSMLLTGDAEAEAVPIDPGPVDVLKVAHHGSEDAGLGELLDRSVPKLAVISVGAGNSYGHPTEPPSPTLRAHGVPDHAHGPAGRDRHRGERFPVDSGSGRRVALTVTGGYQVRDDARSGAGRSQALSAGRDLQGCGQPVLRARSLAGRAPSVRPAASSPRLGGWQR